MIIWNKNPLCFFLGLLLDFHKQILFTTNISSSSQILQHSKKCIRNHFCNAYTTLVHDGNFEFKKSSALVYT